MTSIHEVFSGLGIPDEIKQAYLNQGIENLYGWQAECLYSTNVLRGDNLVYCAPTSGGKTFIAELVLLKNVINRRKRAIFVLPYVSLVLEKHKYFQKILRGLNATLPQKIRVKSYYGDQNKMSRKHQDDIIICTIEKANMICNDLLKRKWMHSIGCVIFDETHVLGSSFNGYLLEIFISKLLFFNHFSSSSSISTSYNQYNQNIQIVALSATMGNVQQMATWLQARLYITTFRPVPLHEYIKAGNFVMSTKGDVVAQLPNNEFGKEDPDGIGLICLEGIRKRQQVIIFCPTKSSCVETCVILSKIYGNICHRDSLEQSVAYRRDVVENKIGAAANNPYQESAREALLNGYAYHHAGLDSDTREWVETAFLQGHVSVLCATSTLAAGVNLPAGRVIIRSLYMGKDLMSVANYKQMAGRAGRAGQSTSGESFLVVKPIEKEKAIALVNQAMPDIKSQINPYIDNGSAMLKALVEVIGLEMCHRLQDIFDFIGSTLWAHQLEQSGDNLVLSKKMMISTVVNTFVKFLFDMQIIYKKDYFLLSSKANMASTNASDLSQEVEVSRLGKGILDSNFGVDEAMVIYQALHKALNGLSLDTPLHLLYLISPLDHNFFPNFSKLLTFYDRSKKAKNNSLAKVFDAVGGSVPCLLKWQVHPPTKQDIQMCHQVVKTSGIEACLQEIKVQLVEDDKHANKLKRPSSHTSNEWQMICVSKRFWAAMILQNMLEGVSLDRLCKEYQCEMQDLEELQKRARMMTSKIQLFCKQLGWTTMYKLIKKFKHTLDLTVPKELKKLLTIPGMTRKVAKVLSECRVRTAEQLVKVSVEEVVLWLQLSIGFELQDIKEVEMVFQGSSNLSIATNEETKTSESISYAKSSTTAALTRDDMIRNHLIQLVSNLLESARLLCSGQQEELYNKEQSTVESSDVECDAIGALLDKNNIEQDKLEDESTDDSEEQMTSDSEEEEVDEEVDPFMNVDEDQSSIATLSNYNLMINNNNVVDIYAEDLYQLDENEEGNIKSTLGNRKGLSYSAKGFHSELREEDCRSPLAKVARKGASSPSNTLQSSPLKDEILELTHSVRKMQVTPMKSTTKPIDIYISDEELLRQVEEWEATGLLYQSSFEEVSDSDILKAMESCEASLSLIYVPFSQSQPINQMRTINSNSLAYETLIITIEGVSDKQELYYNQIIPSSNRTTTQSFATAESSSPIDAMEMVDIDDDLLLKAVDEWEKNQVSMQLMQPKDSTSNISQEVNKLAQGINTVGVTSTISPNLIANKSEQKKSSPYITPFTASKFTTPGKYLYLPKEANSSSNYLDSAYLNNADDYTSLTNSCSLNKSNIDAVLNHLQVRVLTDLQSVQDLCAQLSQSHVMAFELIFKPLPKHLLHAYTKPNKIKDGLQSWSSYISTFVSPIYHVTSQITDYSIASVTQGYNVNNKEVLQGNYVLTGVSFCIPMTSLGGNSGEVEVYYLSLPCLLPLPKFSMSSNYAPSPMDLVPMRCKQMIVAFCGFERLIQKSMGIKEFHFGPSKQSSFASNANPLFSVSRNWCLVARYTAVIYWRKGLLGLEWKFFQDLVTNPQIVKVSTHIQSKLSVLKEREISIRGPIYDPSIACTLLTTMRENMTSNSIYLPGGINHYQYAGLSDFQRSLQVSAARCVTTLYAMSAVIVKLQEQSLWEVYSKIEMPLLVSVSDMDFNGIEVDVKELSDLRKDLLDRKQVIESYFSTLYGREFSLESANDTKKVKDLILKHCKNIYEANAITSKYQQHSINPIKRAGRSDWSIGKELSNSAQDQESRILRHAKEHILWQMISEYHSHTKVLPNLSAVLSNRKFQRTRPHYCTLGTETGRVIANQPPIQQYPKLSKYVPCHRPTLHNELTSNNANNRTTYAANTVNQRSLLDSAIHAFNLSLQSKAQSGSYEYVKFTDKEALEIASRFSLCKIPVECNLAAKLVLILPCTIVDNYPIDLNQYSYADLLSLSVRSTVNSKRENYSDNPYLQQWQSYGDFASTCVDPLNPTHLVLVEIVLQKEQVVRLLAPANKIYRVNSPVLPPLLEQQIVQNCFSPDYFRSLFHMDAAVERPLDKVGKLVQCRHLVQSDAAHIFIAADYCQIELRLLAHFIGQGSLVDAFQRGNDDIFINIAAKWYGKERQEIGSQERQVTKQICYAIIYGAGCRYISEELSTTIDEAEKLYHSFLRTFPEILTFIEKVKEQCAEKGYVETLLGRKRRLKHINSKDPSVRARAERQAVNTLCQGSAADLIKLAMINIHTKLEEWSRIKSDCHFRSLVSHPGGGLYRALDDVRLVLQVHDELIYEVKEEHFAEVANIVRECMEQAVTLNVPLKVKISKGRSWGELEQTNKVSITEPSEGSIVHNSSNNNSQENISDMNNVHIVQNAYLDCSYNNINGGNSVVKNLFGTE